MKTQKLIPLLDYVLEQDMIPVTSNSVKEDFCPINKLNKIMNYAKFLSQPLKLSQFVPCHENEFPLVEPILVLHFMNKQGYFNYEGFEKAKEAYNKAKSKVLFECFSLIGNNHVEYKGFVVGLGFKNGIFKTIEDLTKHNNTKNILTLTENAVKTINR